MIVTVVIGHYENETFEILFMGEMSNRRAYWLLLHYLFYFHLTVSSTGVVFATSEQIAQTDLQQQSNTPTMKALASKQTCLKYFGNALRSSTHTIQNTFYLYYLYLCTYMLCLLVSNKALSNL